MNDSGCAIISSAICLAFGGRSDCNSRTRDRIPLTDDPALEFERVTRALANTVEIHLVDSPRLQRFPLRGISILVCRRDQPGTMMAHVSFRPATRVSPCSRCRPTLH